MSLGGGKKKLGESKGKGQDKRANGIRGGGSTKFKDS